MHSYIDILHNTLEGMAADADDNGKDYIQPRLTLDDVKIILECLNMRKPSQMLEPNKMVAINSPLSDTVEGMLHPDYKERFKAEYHQTKIRFEKLKAFNNKIEAACCTGYQNNRVQMPKHDCPDDMLREQQNVMEHYLHILEVRAVIEGVEL